MLKSGFFTFIYLILVVIRKLARVTLLYFSNSRLRLAQPGIMHVAFVLGDISLLIFILPRRLSLIMSALHHFHVIYACFSIPIKIYNSSIFLLFILVMISC
jgi:hypothetical protein